jgi:hypothetical protein
MGFIDDEGKAFVFGFDVDGFAFFGEGLDGFGDEGEFLDGGNDNGDTFAEGFG